MSPLRGQGKWAKKKSIRSYSYWDSEGLADSRSATVSRSMTNTAAGLFRTLEQTNRRGTPHSRWNETELSCVYTMRRNCRKQPFSMDCLCDSSPSIGCLSSDLWSCRWGSVDRHKLVQVSFAISKSSSLYVCSILHIRHIVCDIVLVYVCRLGPLTMGKLSLKSTIDWRGRGLCVCGTISLSVRRITIRWVARKLVEANWHAC